MDHITNYTSLIGPCDVIPMGAQNPRFPVVGHRVFNLTTAKYESIIICITLMSIASYLFIFVTKQTIY